MPPKYKIFVVPDDAASEPEVLGTKPKFWYREPELGTDSSDEGPLCLFKEGRSNTGEDWAEKAVCELALLLNLPHARYELAEWRGVSGVITPLFVLPDQAIFFGNEILYDADRDYPPPNPNAEGFYQTPQHTLRLVLKVMNSEGLSPPLGWESFPGVSGAADVFIGYLMLDAFVGNTDRHHENWAWVWNPGKRKGSAWTLHLAPTYDHASSLGRELSDAKRSEKLTTSDKRASLRAYVDKARSAFYNDAGDPRPMGTYEAFDSAARDNPVAAQAWINRLADLQDRGIDALFERFPDDRITDPAVEFAKAFLKQTKERIVKLGDELA